MTKLLFTGTTTAWTPTGSQVVTYQVFLDHGDVERDAKIAAANKSGKRKSGPVVVRITSRKAVQS